MTFAHIETPLGMARLVGDADGLREIKWVEEGSASGVIPPILQKACQQIIDYFEGNRAQFEIKLNPQGTTFQKKVWKALVEIPFGKTLSYLELSRKLGDEKAIRAVASANGKNPLWIVIPCHRVIGTDGSLTGYAGGLWRKEWLLNHEREAKQLQLF